MESDFTYDLLIIGGGISGSVFASKYLQKNIKIGHRQLTVYLPPRSGGDIKLFIDNVLNQLEQFRKSIEINI